MDTRLTDEQEFLKKSVAKFCQAEIPIEKVRDLADSPAGITDDLWQNIADQGWLGLLIPEDEGGVGLGVTDLGLICEETGRALMPGPFLSTVLAAHAVTLGGTDAAKKQWLEKAAAGEAKGSIALLEEDGQLGPASVHLEAARTTGGFTLNGKKCLVPDVGAADFVLVAARTSDGDDGVSLFLVDASASGISVAENFLTDQTSRSGQLTLKEVSVDETALVGIEGKGWEIVDEVLLVANVCIAASSVAGAEYIHQLTTDYAKVRTQFGKPIGSFQAIKHPLANLFAEIESARSTYHYAAWAVDAKSGDARSAAAVARLTATQAYLRTTLDCLQATGGIAFTWEYDLHLYLKRAKHYQHLWGVDRDYEEIIAVEALGI